MPLIVKICGINTAEAMDAALDAGADMVGLVFFPRSPRNVTLAAARALAGQACGRAEIAALTVDADDALLGAIVDAVQPHWLQLHGHESVERVVHVQQNFGLPVMKAFGVASRADLGPIGPYAGVAERLLIDAKPPGGALRPGGNGLPFDWRLLADPELRTPFMLSGGLAPETVGEAINLLNSTPSLLGVDVSSGVERAPGVKDAARIKAFVAAARAHGTARDKDRVA